MTHTEALNYMREKMAAEPDIRAQMARIASDDGFDDFYAWADASPTSVIEMAEAFADLDGQLGVFEERLARGDLS